MYRGIDNAGIDNSPIYQNQPHLGAFFMVLIIVCNFFLFNFFIGVVISSFNREKEKLSKDATLNDSQRLWLQTKIIVLKQNPKKRISRPTKSDLRAKVYDICIDSRFENLIFLCIMLNTISMSIKWYEWPYDNIEEKINNVFLFVFGMEALLKIFGFGLRYFTVAWNIFDIVIVVASIITYYVTTLYPSLALGSSATVLRSIKLGRLIKLVKRNRSLIVIF